VKPKPKDYRVDRGGGWDGSVPSGGRGANRNRYAPSGRNAAVGLRPVLDSPKEKR